MAISRDRGYRPWRFAMVSTRTGISSGKLPGPADGSPLRTSRRAWRLARTAASIWGDRSHTGSTLQIRSEWDAPADGRQLARDESGASSASQPRSMSMTRGACGQPIRTNGRIRLFDLNGNALGAIDGCPTDSGCLRRPGAALAGGNGYCSCWRLRHQRRGARFSVSKSLMASMPDVPVMAAATPAA